MDAPSGALFLLVLLGGPLAVLVILVGGPLVRLAGSFFGISGRRNRRPLI
jgi:hypothetical protein